MISVALHVDQLFSPTPGGIGTYIREVGSRLSRRPDVRLLPFHARSDRTLDEPWVRTLELHQLSRSARALYPAWDLAGRPSLPADLGGADVLHAPLPAAIPPPGPGQKLVVTIHDLAFRHYPRLFPTRWLALYRLGARRAARRAHAIMVPSESTKRDLVRLEKADPERVHVVPLAASLPARQTDFDERLHRLKVSRPYVLFVGTLEPRKNLVRLIRAYRQAVTHGRFEHSLVLAGPLGWHPEPLLREIRSPGAGRVILTGKATATELDGLYRAADLFVYPSLYEGFGLPVLEAMARGVPSIVSTASSLPEVAGEAAFGVDPTSVPGLASAIERLLTDTGEAERLAKAGLARAEEFSWDRTADETLDVYRRALG